MHVSQRDYRILIGTAGWQYPEWGNEVFYPEDLPQDWYLSFYSNEFPVVLIAESRWAGASETEQIVDEISEQATEGFKCIFELDLRVQNSMQTRLQPLARIENFLGGLLVHAKSNFVEDKKLCQQLVSLHADFNVCLDIDGDTDLPALAVFCEQHAISVCWRGEGEVIVPDASPLWLTRCDSGLDKKVLVQQLKTIIAKQLKLENPSREHVLIIDGAPPSVEITRNASIMMDIM